MATSDTSGGPPPPLQFIDIGVNLTDPVFHGLYRGRQAHPSDFADVLRRAACVGVSRLIVTGGSLTESAAAIQLCRHQPPPDVAAAPRLHCTVGCHPTRSQEMEADPAGYLAALRRLAKDNADVVVAIGETGLDYDREQFAGRDVQMRHFRSQLALACDLRLPLFLHCRASHTDFRAAVAEFADRLPQPPGVVHTFDGTAECARQLLDMGFYLGLNGCSLKTPESLEVVAGLPLDRLLLETDAPWCEVKPSHAGHRHVTTKFESRRAERWSAGCLVKGRNEPACIVQVLEVVAGARGQAKAEVAAAALANTARLFRFSDPKG